jgi:hypothetical protein
LIEIIIIKIKKKMHTEANHLDHLSQAVRSTMEVIYNLDGCITRIRADHSGMERETFIKNLMIKEVHSKVKREIMNLAKEKLFITMIKKNQEELRLLKIHQKKPKFQL